MTTTATKPKIYRLSSRAKQASFVRKEMRKEGLTVQELADRAGLCWVTVARYADLCTWNDMTKEPRFSTAKKIFHALGYDILFGAKDAKGIVEL